MFSTRSRSFFFFLFATATDGQRNAAKVCMAAQKIDSFAGKFIPIWGEIGGRISMIKTHYICIKPNFYHYFDRCKFFSQCECILLCEKLKSQYKKERKKYTPHNIYAANNNEMNTRRMEKSSLFTIKFS